MSRLSPFVLSLLLCPSTLLFPSLPGLLSYPLPPPCLSLCPLRSYGATKSALRQFHSTLLQELRGSGVGIHTASPGMVLTDLLLR